MITADNLADVLMNRLEFTQIGDESDFFYRHFDETGCDVSVSFREKQLKYPGDITINDTTTCNFEKNENFVVFECVCRLLEKGYSPNHIELEPRWKLGHEAKSGKADIWIRTVNDAGEKESLLIIECKTPGDEYNGAWKDTLYDGAQLFSYFEQEKGTRFLCLYTCNLANGVVEPEYRLINVQDNEEYLSTLKSPKSYQKALNNVQRFSVWKETYGQESATRGLFEDDIAAYHIGKTKYTVADLQEIDSVSMQKKYHEFATILRQHNVSSHENAFDKLVNLFLAKVVDESDNPGSLSFYWKGKAYDDAFRLQDRLQKLYKIGMEKFLHDEVTYIDNQDINRAFRRFKKDPDETKRNILDMFRRLKFFTNSDFAFIDVHNENLFNQNAEVLLKIVRMLEDIKVKTEESNQFLGDLFEGFLDQGIKQSEGQFFTPLPIVRFMISSLPLESLISESSDVPSVIDYACGAGHFLNEYARQIEPYVEAKGKNRRDYYSSITGIEKEYRLSKVSKVAAFMYGQDDINIIYADALSDIPEVKDNSYSLLVANPPYSVKGFLETLTEKDLSKFTLTKDVSDFSKNNSIETFFVERASQLLKEDGVAAIILPSSILSNGGIYVKCREILLKYFEIIAISEFGTGTFGKTGTNTVTLFLRRRPRVPDASIHFRNRVNAWFSGSHDGDEVFDDEGAIRKYSEHIGVDYDDYMSLFDSGFDYKALKTKYEIFGEYVSEFTKSASYKTILKKRITGKYTEEAKVKALDDYIRRSILAIEMEKLYYFLLATDCRQPVVVVKAPSDSKAMKRFLGYEWSGAKGNEGIKYIGVDTSSEEDDITRNSGISKIKTPLFNPQDLMDQYKINSLIRNNFGGKDIVVPEEYEELVHLYSMVDLLDFKRTSFDKSIRTRPILSYPSIKVREGIPTDRLANVAPYVTTTIKMTDINVSDFISTDNMLQGCEGVTQYSGTPGVDSITEFRKGDILVSNIRPYLKKIWMADRDGGCSKDVLVFRNCKPDTVLNDYLKIILSTDTFFEYMMVGKKGLKMPRGDKKQIPSFIVPLPPLSIQYKIAEEFAKIDDIYYSCKEIIKNNRQAIINKANSYYNNGTPKEAIGALCEMPQYGANVSAKDGNPDSDYRYIRITDIDDYGHLNDNWKTAGKIEEQYILQDGDFLFARTGATAGKTYLYKARDGKSIYAGYLIRFRPKIKLLLPEYLAFITQSFNYRKWAEETRGGTAQPNINAQQFSELTIPLVSMEEQQKVTQEISTYEEDILLSENTMKLCTAQKLDILAKFLC